MSALSAFVATGDATDGSIANWVAACSYGGLAMDSWRVDADGGLAAFDNGDDLRAVVRLPETAGSAEALGGRAAAFTEWVRQVAQGFRHADTPYLGDLLALGGAAGYTQGLGPDVGGACCAPTSRSAGSGSCALYGSCPRLPASILPVPGGDPDFVLSLPDGDRLFTPEQWRWLLQTQGIFAPAPIHFVIHGLGGDSVGAAGEIDSMYPNDDDAVVIAVNWPTGGMLDFTTSHFEADTTTGDKFGAVLAGVNLMNPQASVALTGHSLGGKVIMEGLAAYEAWLTENGVDNELTIDAVLIQPAIYNDDGDIAVLHGPLVSHLTITVDDGDDSLGAMEGDGGDVLGDEDSGQDNDLFDIVIARQEADVETVVVDHSSDHLEQNPADHSIVDVVVASQVDAVAGQPANPALDLLVMLDVHGFEGEHTTDVLTDPDILAQLDELRDDDQPWPGGL